MDMLNSSQQLLTKSRRDDDKSSYDCSLLVNPIDLGIQSTITQSLSLSLRNSKLSDIDKLSSALYQIANRNMTLMPPGKPLDESLDIVINRTPRYVLLKLIESDSPTIRAVFEKLASVFDQLRQKDDFFSLVEAICLFHPKWIRHRQLLNFAGRLGCVDSCRLILRTWHRLGYINPSNRFIDAVLDSIQVGNVVCAKMIFEHVLESSTTLSQPEDTPAVRIFWMFLQAVAEGSLRKAVQPVRFELKMPAVSQMLEWFLETGANIDLSPRLA
ncbi:hypothetical protein GGS24DRAFT_484451 [Hypoxylon argillaceum]|nr:hypothetical protein GGS24DRAFT_484451 [Hypoxylon argillaceum]